MGGEDNTKAVAPPQTSFFAFEKWDISASIVGLGVLPLIEDKPVVITNFGGLFRISRNIIGSKEAKSDGTFDCLIDVGFEAYAVGASNSKIDSDVFWVVGGGAGIGIWNGFITVTPGFCWVFNENLSEGAFIIVITSAALKLN